MKTVEKGSYIIRMDQPYRAQAQILLDIQTFPKNAKPPYGDTGWTFPFAFNIEAFKVNDAAILHNKMELLRKT